MARKNSPIAVRAAALLMTVLAASSPPAVADKSVEHSLEMTLDSSPFVLIVSLPAGQSISQECFSYDFHVEVPLRGRYPESTLSTDAPLVIGGRYLVFSAAALRSPRAERGSTNRYPQCADRQFLKGRGEGPRDILAITRYFVGGAFDDYVEIPAGTYSQILKSTTPLTSDLVLVDDRGSVIHGLSRQYLVPLSALVSYLEKGGR